ncbi:MAG: hypothetical protein ACLGJB_00770 [Blastocatellia bacterium]
MTAIMILLALTSGPAQGLRSLAEEMNRLHTNTALILPSDAVDEHPLWAPSSNYIAVNVMDKWYKVNLLQISLKASPWRGKQRIGVITSKSSVSEATDQEVEQWAKVSKFNERALTTKAGTRIELRETDLGTTLTIRKRNQRAEKIWTSDVENCHSLVLSAGEEFVAFICESNGVVVMRLNGPK